MVPSTAPSGPAAPQGFDHFMARLTGSGRAAVERHLAACEKDLEPDHARVWKRLIGLLGRLTPDAVPVPAARAGRRYRLAAGLARVPRPGHTRLIPTSVKRSGRGDPARP